MTGANLLTLLESRLDNVVYRLGFADSRPQARQLVQHGHFNVNGRRTNVSSFILRPGDKVEVRPGSRKRTYFRQLRDVVSDQPLSQWLERDATNLTGQMVRLPERHDIEMAINEQLIVEYYSR
jgi:small subunit ribosomal protein S4